MSGIDVKVRLPVWVVVALVTATVGARDAASQSVQRLTLKSDVYGNTRSLHVLLPSSYDESEAEGRRYPVVYFLDGAPAFDPRGWGAAAAVTELAASGRIEEFILVGIDNGGSTRETANPVRDRASEYLPYADETWEGTDAPVPLGSRFPDFLFEEVAPLVDSRFRTRAGKIGLAGDSYAAAAALFTALQHPERVGTLLLESPPLHISGNRLLEDARAADAWPETIYLGVGTAEGETRATQERVVALVRRLADIIRDRESVEHCVLVVEGGTHWFDAWRERLPTALVFLYGNRGETSEGAGDSCVT